MRSTRFTTIALVGIALVAGVGLKLALFGAPHAAAVVRSATLDVYQMQQNANGLPDLKFKDMTFVFLNE